MESGIKGETAAYARALRTLLRVRGKRKLAIILAAVFSLACEQLVKVGHPAGDVGRQAASSPTPEPARTATPTPPIAAEEPEMDAGTWFASQVDDTNLHAALIASLSPGRTIARLNPDKPFNPASLVKLATSLAALKKLGPDHRFEVRVHADGELRADGTFDGDLYFSGAAPTFNWTSAVSVSEELRERGIKSVTGEIRVTPDFSYGYGERPEQSAELLSKELFPKRPPATAVAERPSGDEIFVVRSHRLADVLLYQNTFSSNIVAHRVGDAVGGPDGVRRFLVDDLGLPAGEVRLETTSGLGENAMTARGIFAVLREFDTELSRHGLKPQDVLPVTGESWSTLDTRLRGSVFENAIAGKTGTLSAADGGVGMASLAGYVQTVAGERLGFVLMDEGPAFRLHRELQDAFLLEALTVRIEPLPVRIERSRNILPRSGLEILDRAVLTSE